jgi:hypothetical protein
MAKSVEILRNHLGEHPAVRAWHNLEAKRITPRTVAVIKPWKHRKSGIYRLAGIGPGGCAIMAKRCPRETALIERPIYEEFLPQVGLPALRCYGSVQDPDGDSHWLFLDEAHGEPYSPLDSEHRALAARWIAAIHCAGRPWAGRLPARDLAYYLGLLRASRAKARESACGGALPQEEAAVLRRAADQCDRLEEAWGRLEDVCRAAPETVVHGDFVARNVRVRPSPDGLQMVVFDWEFAGYGTPAIDLVQFSLRSASPDLSTYRSRLGWPATEPEVRRLAACGTFLQIVNAMWWASFGLKGQVPEELAQPVLLMKTYTEALARAMSEAGWTNHD